MLIAEYDYATDIAVQREEAGRIAFVNGIKQGKSLGLAEGEARGKSLGLAEGFRQAKLETAKTMLTMGYPLVDICKISGLAPDEVQSIGNV